jgi:hypothetical protein
MTVFPNKSHFIVILSFSPIVSSCSCSRSFGQTVALPTCRAYLCHQGILDTPVYTDFPVEPSLFLFPFLTSLGRFDICCLYDWFSYSLSSCLDGWKLISAYFEPCAYLTRRTRRQAGPWQLGPVFDLLISGTRIDSSKLAFPRNGRILC